MPAADLKFAVLVGKKLGPAVVRNRHKRWAREAFRQHKNHITKKGELVVRIHTTAEDYYTLERDYLRALELACHGCHSSD